MPTKEKSYYGPVYWLGVAAFVAPVFVAISVFQALPGPYTQPDPNPDAAGVDQALWDYLLKTYVSNGLVDYDGLRRNHLFKTYLQQVGAARPDALPTDNDRLAFYTNAYNALVMNGVITHGITDSVMNLAIDGAGFFDLKEHIVAGMTMSLNELEHKTIRPTFNEPRVHVTLVCAARSCPPIRPEAYTGANIERQMEDQAVQFANSTKYVRYDASTNTLHLSTILEWYGEDFEAGGGYLAFLAERVEDATLRNAIQKAQSGGVNVVFNDYDWTLNAQKPRPGAGSGGKKTDFGSGSIPNE